MEISFEYLFHEGITKKIIEFYFQKLELYYSYTDSMYAPFLCQGGKHPMNSDISFGSTFSVTEVNKSFSVFAGLYCTFLQNVLETEDIESTKIP